MRVTIYIVILALALIAPVDRVDVAQLLPIEAVAVYMEGDTVVLETDTEHTGRGESAAQALQNLKDETPAVVYLDTAEYLLVSENAVAGAEGLREYLKPSVKVSICDAKGAVKNTAQYLRIHGDVIPLEDWSGGE